MTHADTDKTRYRSSVVVQYGKPISVEPYIEAFLKDPKPAVKRLTADILATLTSLTINAPDWDSLNAALMARQLLWPDERRLALRDVRHVTQTLAEYFANEQGTGLRNQLVELNSALEATKLTNASLRPLTLPADLDPARPVRLPTRFGQLLRLVGDTLKSLIRLPFFAAPLLVHLPAYVAARAAARYLNPDDERESWAQNKVCGRRRCKLTGQIVVGILALAVVYIVMFFSVWAVFFLSPIGFVLAIGLCVARTASS